MGDPLQIIAISYALPPSLFPQSIQIGRLLYHCPAEVRAISGQAENASMDCYPDFSERMAFHAQVPFSPVLPAMLHRLARKFISLYGRAPDEFRSWIPAAEKIALEQLAQNPEAQIVSFGEPMSDHLLGLRLKQKTGRPWIAHFSDPWADNPFRKFFIFANVLNRRMEEAVIGAADQVIFTSQETLSLVMRKYPAAWLKKAHVLPHSYDPALYPSVSSLGEGKIIIRYLGSFYGNRTPFPLLAALGKIVHYSPELLQNVRFELIGGIPSRMLKHRLMRSLPTGLVSFLPSVNYKESLRLMKESDLLLVIDAPAALSVFLPSKLVDYLGAGVPIVGIVPRGSSASLIQRVGGLVADPANRPSIIEMLTCALKECRSRKGANDGKPWGNEEVRKEYAIEHVGKQFLEILTDAG
jgi:glycosyltransferase involved in cell wall biosynthesis